MINTTNRSGDSCSDFILRVLCHWGAWNEKMPMGRNPLTDTKRMFITCLLSALLLICNGCGTKDSKSPYKVIDSGIWAEEAGIESTGWIDNNHILFITNKTLKPTGKIPLANHLTVWNPDTGKVDFYHQASLLKCVRKGKVLFTEDSGPKWKKPKWEPSIYQGTVENPQDHPAPGLDMRIDSSFDCDWVPGNTSGRDPIKAPHKYKLRGENYIEFIELSTDASPGKMVYHEKPGTKGTPLPFYLSLAYSMSYSEFLDAYVIFGDKRSVYLKPDTRSFWILERNGNLRSIDYPLAMMKGYVRGIYPLKCGYMVQYGQEQYKATDPGDNGLWLANGEKAIRLIVGAIHAVSVSPDGCRAAFIHARHSNEYFSQKNPYRTIKVINFCKREK